MKHRLETANGYLELGMPMEAWDELDAFWITSPFGISTPNGLFSVNPSENYPWNRCNPQSN